MGIRGAIRATWNGPFYVGKLEKPVKSGEVLLKLLETIWRESILCGVAFLLLISGAGIYELTKNTQYQHRNAEYDPSISFDGKMRMAVGYPSDRCDSSRPILITITNLTNQSILRYRWSIAAHREGRSTNIIWGLPDAGESSDYVITPRGHQSFCMEIPRVAAEAMQSDRIIFTPNYIEAR